MQVRTYHKNGKAVQFLGYSDIDASNAAKVVMGEVGDVGYFKPRPGVGYNSLPLSSMPRCLLRPLSVNH